MKDSSFTFRHPEYHVGDLNPRLYAQFEYIQWLNENVEVIIKPRMT